MKECRCGLAFSPSSSRQIHCGPRCRAAAKRELRGRRVGPPCLVEGCDRPAAAKRYCQMHYGRQRINGDPGEAASRRTIRLEFCIEPGCTERTSPKCGGSLCARHYRARRLENAGPCSVEDCTFPAAARGLCYRHNNRLARYGEPGPAGLLRRENGAWRPNGHGYMFRVVPGTAKGKRRGKVGGGFIELQHRVVMEAMIGRPLRPGENIHHINGIRHDNRPENLELWSRSQPAGQRVTDKTAWAIEWLETYAPELLAAKPVQLRLA